MTERTFGKRGNGYFLPEDSQRLLRQLGSHIKVLARQAQPRIDAETVGERPMADTAELAVRLDQLAEQLEQVLRHASLLERPRPTNASRDAAAETDEDSDEADDAAADEADDAYAAEASDQPVVLGVTMDQFDKLSLLVQGIKAYGDAVSAEGRADFAEGTLTMLGHTIFDRAVEVDEILGEIDAQTLEQGARSRFAVEEPRAAYGVEVPGERAPMRSAWSAMGHASLADGPSLGGVSVH